MTTRREFLVLACGAAAAAAATTVEAQLDPNQEALRRAAFREAVRKITGGTVPLSVSVESPMTPADHVRAIHVFTEKNPQPNVLSVHLGPRAGRASIVTRVRIADTQTVTAIAQLSDGTFWSDSAHVVVTLSACLEDGLI